MIPKMLCTSDIVNWNQRRTIATAVGSHQRWNNDSGTEVGEPFPSRGIATSAAMTVEWNYEGGDTQAVSGRMDEEDCLNLTRRSGPSVLNVPAAIQHSRI